MPFRMPPPVSSPLTSSSSTSSSSTPTSPTSSNPLPASTISHSQATATLRLPAPPLPPKPLHLTISKNSTLSRDHHSLQDSEDTGTVKKERSKGTGRGRRGEMPRWSRYGQAEEDGAGEGGTIKGKGMLEARDQEEQELKEARKGIEVGLSRNGQGKEEEDEPTMSQLLSASTSTRSHRRKDRSDVSSNQSFKSASRTLKVGGMGSGEEGGGSTIKRRSIYFDPTNKNPLEPPELQIDQQEDVVAEKESVSEEQSDGKEKDRTLLDTDDSTAPGPPDLNPSLPLSSDTPQLELPSSPLLAISLHSFAGESTFGELSFEGGIELCIEVEDLGGGWSLGYLRKEGEEGRGLIPRGWYAYVDLDTEKTPVSIGQDRLVSKEQISKHPTQGGPTLSNDSLDSPLESAPPSPDIAAVPRSTSNSSLPSSLHLSPTPPQVDPVSISSFTTAQDVNLSLPSTPPTLPTTSSNPLDSPPISPRSYASKSIGRHLVTSGTEFEPIELEIAQGGESNEQVIEELSGIVPGGEAKEDYGVGEAIEQVEGKETNEEESINVNDEGSAIGGLEQDTMKELTINAAPNRVAQETLPTPPRQRLTTTDSSPTISTSLPPRHSISRPLAQSSSSFFYRLGLTSAPTAPPTASYLLGGLSIPGASLIAHSTNERHSVIAKRERLSRNLGVMGGTGYVMEWIRKGDEFDEEIGEDTQVWDVDEGPTFRSTTQPLVVQLHSPRKVSPLGENPYTSFQLTTHFPSSSSTSDTDSPDPLSVSRRYSHFVSLHQLLTARYSLLSIPPLAPKAYGATRFSDEFVEERRRDLERWVGKVGRHPVLRETEEVRRFLSLEEDKDLRQLLSNSNSASPITPLFFARVFHPEFNIDVSEAEDIGERFERHVKAIEIGGGVRNVETSVQKHRETSRDNAITLRNLATSLSRLVAGLALPSTSYDPPRSAYEMEAVSNESEVVQAARRAKEWKVQNEVGALSWREEDGDALSLSKAVQASAEALASIADSVHETARYDLIAAQLLLQELAQPATQYAALLASHKQALIEYRRLNRLSTLERADQVDQLSRCETILNVTCAEMDHIRSERTEDFKEAVRLLLDAEIALREQSLEQLRFARGHFDGEAFPLLALSGPRLRSTLERPATLPLYPALPSVRSFMVPRTTTSTVTGAIGSTLLRRGSTQTSSNAAREREESIDEVVEEGVDEGDGTHRAGRGSWRESVIGTMRMW